MRQDTRCGVWCEQMSWDKSVRSSARWEAAFPVACPHIPSSVCPDSEAWRPEGEAFPAASCHTIRHEINIDRKTSWKLIYMRTSRWVPKTRCRKTRFEICCCYDTLTQSILGGVNNCASNISNLIGGTPPPLLSPGLSVGLTAPFTAACITPYNLQPLFAAFLTRLLPFIHSGPLNNKERLKNRRTKWEWTNINWKQEAGKYKYYIYKDILLTY